MSNLYLKPLFVIVFCISAARVWGAETTTPYQQAQEAVRRGAWDEALGIVGRLLKVNPRDLKVLNLEGLAFTGKGDLRRADQAFEEALRIDPGFHAARKNLAINQISLKETAQAEENFRLLLKALPGDPVINMYVGGLDFQRKEYALAAGHLSAAKPFWQKDARLPVMLAECDFQLARTVDGVKLLQSIEPGRLDAIWQFHAGSLLARHERFDAAARFFEAARDGYPQAYDVLFNLGVCYVQTKKYSQAVDVLSELHKRGNPTSELDNLLAEAYENNKQTQEAIDLLREATTLAPNEERNYLDLAMLCAEHKAYDLGLEVVKVGLHYLPYSDALLIQRGVIFAMTGRYEEAEKDFNAAGQGAKSRDAAYTGLGLVYIQKGDVAKAVEVLRQRVKQDAENAALQYLLGEALIRTGIGPTDPEYSEALAALEKSVRLDPNFVYSRTELAKIYLMRNRNSDAIQQLRTAIVIDPSRVQPYAQLGAALRKEGKLEEAAPMFEKVRELNAYNRLHGEPVPLVRGSEHTGSGAR